MNRQSPQHKPKSWLVRVAVNSAIMAALFYNPELMENVCGPFTLPISNKNNLLLYVIFVQLVRVLFQPLLSLLGRISLLNWAVRHTNQLLVVKYLVVLMLKFFLIFEQSHRKKFYLHSFLLEALIILTAVLFDIIQKHNIKEAGELLILEGLHRLSVVYELTQTFCPNLILYYAFTNLLVFVIAQIESQQRYGINQSLYVKHDVYRFLFMSILFFCFIAIAQLFTSSFKMMVTFLLSFKWLLNAIYAYSQNKFKQSCNNLLWASLVIAGCELLFIKLPFNGETSYRLQF